MNKSLLFTALMAGSAFFAHAQVTDVTAKYIANPGFEQGTDGTAASSGKGSFTPYCWTIANAPTQYYNSGIYSANETGNTSASAFGTTVAPAEGDYYFFVRKSWGAADPAIVMSQNSAKILPEGKYLLTANYKVATNDGTSKPYFTLGVSDLTSASDDYLGIAESEKGAQQGNTYFNTAKWSKISVPFEVTSEAPVTFSMVFYFGTGGANQNQDAILLDNFQLLTGDVDNIPALDGAFETLKGMISTAEALAADNTGLDFSQKISEAEAIIAKNYENSLADVNDFITSFENALKSVYDKEADVTALTVKNASFETGNGTGWTWNNASDTGVKPNSNATYTTEGVDGAYLFNTWGGSSEKYIKQTVEITHDGFYTLEALGASDDGLSVTIYAGSAKADIQLTGKGQFIKGVTPKIFCKAGSTLEIGATSNTWYKVDNFHLLYAPASLDAALKAYQNALAKANEVDIEAEDMNKDVRNALNEAKNAEVSEDDFDALTEATAKLESATAAAKKSIAAYAKASQAVYGMQYFLKYNTVADYNVKEEYQSYCDKLTSGLYESTLTDEEAEAVVNPYTVTGWRANPVKASDYLISAWDAEPYDWNNYHVNTWSTEGANDGTEYVVPFIEYWTNDGNVLGAKTMTASIVIDDPDYASEVNTWVRLRLTNGQTDIDFSKIKFAVGEPTTTDEGEVVYNNIATLEDLIEEGAQVETPTADSPFRLIRISKKGVADLMGNLTIQFIVEEGSNVSWLCWKDMIVNTTAIPTGLNKVEKANAATTNGAVYNVAGQKVNGLQKGLNIQNGKKILVK